VANDLLHNNFVYRRQKKSNVIIVFCEYHFHIKHKKFTWPPITTFSATSPKDDTEQWKGGIRRLSLGNGKADCDGIRVTICLSKTAPKQLTGKHSWEGYREDRWGS